MPIASKKILNTSIDKAFKILDCFNDQNVELGVTEIAKKIGTNKSTMYRLLATMESINVIQQNSENNKYRLGLKLFELGNKVSINKNFISKAHPHMEELVETAGETAHLAIYKDQQVFYVDKVEGKHGLQINSQVGSYKPLYCTGMGKIMLAFAIENAAQLITLEELSKKTPNTIINKPKLLKEIEQIKKQGFALNMEESEIGLICVAVPILGDNGKFIAAISTSGPSARFNENEINTYTNDLKNTANKIRTLFKTI